MFRIRKYCCLTAPREIRNIQSLFGPGGACSSSETSITKLLIRITSVLVIISLLLRILLIYHRFAKSDVTLE